MPDPSAQSTLPFNFFAGITPGHEVPLSWVSGYDFVITNISLSTGSESDITTLYIFDAEGNQRGAWQVLAGSPDYPQALDHAVWLVLGPNEGAYVSSTDDNAVCSIDGLICQPIGSGVW